MTDLRSNHCRAVLDLHLSFPPGTSLSPSPRLRYSLRSSPDDSSCTRRSLPFRAFPRFERPRRCPGITTKAATNPMVVIPHHAPVSCPFPFSKQERSDGFVERTQSSSCVECSPGFRSVDNAPWKHASTAVAIQKIRYGMNSCCSLGNLLVTR
jgi:hypothetical protein